MKTFLDSGVLLTAWKGEEADAMAALAVIEDSGREFVSSQIVALELLPKPTYFQREDELEFYAKHLDAVKESAALTPELTDAALVLAKKHGLAAQDALCLASAIALGAGEFITSELPGKPMFRVREIKVTTLHAAAR